MRRIVTNRDALQKAYDAGLLVNKGTLVVEGIGDRRTNWGKGFTLTIRGATLSQARLAVGWYADETNEDKRNQRNGDCLTLRLTRRGEGEQFAASIGLSKPVAAAVAQVDDHDELTEAKRRYDENGGRLYEDTVSVQVVLADNDADALVSVCESIKQEPVVVQWAGIIGVGRLDGLLVNAFIEGFRGLALGTSDLDALQAGEGILDRYGKGAGVAVPA